MRRRACLLLLSCSVALPAAAALVEVEPGNDDFTTLQVFTYSGSTIADAGVFGLTPDDFDLIRLSGLETGLVVSAMTTPLATPFFSPDTVLGISLDGGPLLDFNDDAGDGFGSALRVRGPTASDLFLGVSGLPNSSGGHSEIGRYLLTLSALDPLLALPLTSVVRSTTVGVAAGLMTLSPGVVNRVTLAGLQAGDIVSLITTPLSTTDDLRSVAALRSPTGTLIVADLDPFGRGLTARLLAPESGDYLLEISGDTDFSFTGAHEQMGQYALTASIYAVPEPSVTVMCAFGILGLSLWRRPVRVST